MNNNFYNQITLLKDMISKSKNIVAFTGAGISVPSGIPDFRSSTGLYKTETNGSFPPEYMLSHSCFVNQTSDFYKFYKGKMIYKNAKYNLGHKWLKQLEDDNKLSCVITQNIDGLHYQAGSKNVFEFHGSIYRNYCQKCHKYYDLDYIINSDNIPKCEVCGGVIKPDVVLYEEGLDEDIVQGSINAVMHADMLIVIGTSLVVYPAASLIDYFKGKYLVLINKSSTNYDNNADLVINEDITKVAKEMLEK